MATSLPRVILPVNTWVDLYVSTGIAAGTQLVIQNTGSSEVMLVESATEPNENTTGFNSVPTRNYVNNSAGNVGAWAYASSGGSLQVEEA